MNTSTFLSINYPRDKASQWTKQQLLQAGLRPVQTFDCIPHGLDRMVVYDQIMGQNVIAR